MARTHSKLKKHPVLYPLLLTLLMGVINLLSYYLYEETGFASMNLIVNAMLYGSILFPVYYCLTFTFFFLCIYYSASSAKPVIITALILYIAFTLPFINMNLLTFGF